ncbi:MAG: CHAD domain-containing protein, partial [Hyphomicrobium sp.]
QYIHDKKLRKKLKKIVSEETLSKQFDTNFHRSSQIVYGADGSEVEIAFDEGIVRALDRSKPICEVELELKTGSPKVLLYIAKKLFSNRSLKFSDLSKAESGYQLINGENTINIKPIRAHYQKLSSDHNFEEVITLIFRSIANQIQKNWDFILIADDPEGVHQLRVGLRRLRSALKLFRPIIDTQGLREFDTQARDVGRGLADLRDIDVFLSDILSPVYKTRANDLSFVALKKILVNLRASTLIKVRELLQDKKWSSFKLELAMLPEVLRYSRKKDVIKDFNRPINQLANKLLSKYWKSLTKFGHNLEEMSIEEFHDLRKNLKTLRYSVEMFSSLYPKKNLQNFMKSLRELQNKFGYINDVTLIEKITNVEIKNSDALAQRAVGFLDGFYDQRTQEMRKSIRKEWNKFERRRKFWET